MRPDLPIFTPSLRSPTAKLRPHMIRHGRHQISDDYAWLRAENWREVMQDPQALPEEIQAHLLAENAYCDDAMADTLALQTTLKAEMRARVLENDNDVPAEDGPYAYFFHYRQGGEHPLYARRTVGKNGKLSDTLETLLDTDAIARHCDYFDLGTVSHSPDHRFLAYASDQQGSEYYEIRIVDLSRGETLKDTITSASSHFVWSADSTSIVWIWRDENTRPKEVRLHSLFKSEHTDICLYSENDDGFFLGLSRTSDRQYIVIEVNDHTTSEVHLLDARNPQAGPRIMAPRKPGIEYHVDHSGTSFYILTNADGAEDFKIITAPEQTPGREHWRDLVPSRPGVRRLQQRVFANYHVRLERANALPRIVVRNLDSGEENTIAINGAAYALGLEPLLDFDTTRLRFSTSTMAQPEQIFDYDMETQKRVLRKTQSVPSGHDARNYCVERIIAEADDGEHVPVSIVYHKGLAMDGKAPLLLYGYGAYGITIPAGFSTRRLSLLDRGFVYAIAHIRGGEAKGHAWYTAAKGEGKPNTFYDFIAVAKALISKKYTSKGRIIAMGGSAGGLLVGAVMNQAPTLFAGIIAAVPFVDVLNTMCDETLPLTPPEWPEWGNPLDDAAAFASIKSYSPYDNVQPLDYPPLLATAGLCDPRVTYWEPAKWVAKLREKAPDAGPYFLQTEMQAGHGGLSGRFESLKTTALEYAFAIKAAGRLEDQTNISQKSPRH